MKTQYTIQHGRTQDGENVTYLRSVQYTMDTPASLTEAVEKLGEQVVYNLFRSGYDVDHQRVAREKAKAQDDNGQWQFSDDQIRETMAGYKSDRDLLGTKSERTVKRAATMVDKLSDAEKRALAESMLAQLGEAKPAGKSGKSAK